MDREAEAVVAGTEIGDRAGGFDADPTPDELRGVRRRQARRSSLGAHQPSASRTPSVVAVDSTIRPATVRSAVSGSLSPLPVRTATTRSSEPIAPEAAAFVTPATLAADEGSQNTPSSSAMER